MTTQKVYRYLERISNLLRAEARQAQHGARLQPVQLEILHYLSICNRHSNIPAAVTEYLGLTKGTVSQTISVLEAKGYLEKVPDANDRRVIHLILTEKGREIVEASLPPAVLQDGLAYMSPEERELLAKKLEDLLQAIQKAHRFKEFGSCNSCQYLRNTDTGNVCGLTGLPLEPRELSQICRDYVSVETAIERVA
ncbi:MAG TPA: MarR family transcriptional regulator [Methylothermaceae bacterium]|nr:MarR family transcriptional regulator [Methylothermaceae bacterium]